MVEGLRCSAGSSGRGRASGVRWWRARVGRGCACRGGPLAHNAWHRCSAQVLPHQVSPARQASDSGSGTGSVGRRPPRAGVPARIVPERSGGLDDGVGVGVVQFGDTDVESVDLLAHAAQLGGEGSRPAGRPETNASCGSPVGHRIDHRTVPGRRDGRALVTRPASRQAMSARWITRWITRWLAARVPHRCRRTPKSAGRRCDAVASPASRALTPSRATGRAASTVTCILNAGPSPGPTAGIVQRDRSSATVSSSEDGCSVSTHTRSSDRSATVGGGRRRGDWVRHVAMLEADAAACTRRSTCCLRAARHRATGAESTNRLRCPGDERGPSPRRHARP